MKTLFKINLALIAALFMLFTTKTTASNKTMDDETTVLYFRGITEDGEFEFEDMDGEFYYFQEINEEIEIDLFEDEFIDKKFEVTWEIITYSSDEEDEGTETFTVYKITRLKEL